MTNTSRVSTRFVCNIHLDKSFLDSDSMVDSASAIAHFQRHFRWMTHKHRRQATEYFSIPEIIRGSHSVSAH